MTGVSSGFVAGLILGRSDRLSSIFQPFITAVNSIPRIALAPIIILWFGTGLVSKVALAVSLTAIVALIAHYGNVIDEIGPGGQDDGKGQVRVAGGVR